MDIQQTDIGIPFPVQRVIKYFYYDQDYSAVIRAVKSGRIWEKKLYDLYKDMIQPSDVILDVGAFIGTHTSLFASLVPNGKVYSFEPCSKPHTCLGLMCDWNNFDNVEVFNLAVSNKNEFTTIGTNFDGGSQLKEHHLKKTFSKYETIETITIDSLNLTKCDLIKIDVEKHEWKVLEGAKETIGQFRPNILLETFKTCNNLLKLEEWTTNNFYTYKHLKGDDYLLLSI
jgi:FkbM family methyltransferase